MVLLRVALLRVAPPRATLLQVSSLVLVLVLVLALVVAMTNCMLATHPKGSNQSVTRLPSPRQSIVCGRPLVWHTPDVGGRDTPVEVKTRHTKGSRHARMGSGNDFFDHTVETRQ